MASIARTFLRARVVKPSSIPKLSPSTIAPSPPARRLFSSRSPAQLGCLAGSLLPLHSAVAAARLTSRLSPTTASLSCRALSQAKRHMIFPVFKSSSVGTCHCWIVRFTGFSQGLGYQFQGENASLTPPQCLFCL
ncbi:uncharacterized protein LOC120277159 isoform X2 [Dioscorea cayenensis subsp. rotundata]|uniref:Uncharacterized protein LOC120277159 isoform X2 n=1 Tax=Dioscorea cayennensis subsp. rotundata TaxID=55577 RepID=A0AB40CMW7_DIOCR|nr:uncharacterized protein LOC120277159 isoform X2 [Dioscorea cayenensis subsp. rotundata]